MQRSQNYCFDQCPHNPVPRHYWETTDNDGKKVTMSAASSGTNQRLKCAMGYKQTVNSAKALSHSLSNNAVICSRLRKLFTN